MTTDLPLEAYPRPAFGVDLALLTLVKTADTLRLCVLIQDRDSPAGRALPGRFLRERQTVAQSVADILTLKVRVPPPATTPRLIRLFDDPNRDDRTWTISAAHAISVRASEVEGATGDLVPVRKNGSIDEQLLFDHDVIVSESVAALRERYETRKTYRNVRPDPDRFLDGPVTLAQLREVHEAVLGTKIPRDSFNRRMVPLLEPSTNPDGSDALSSDGVGRPAKLYRTRTSN